MVLSSFIAKQPIRQALCRCYFEKASHLACRDQKGLSEINSCNDLLTDAFLCAICRGASQRISSTWNAISSAFTAEASVVRQLSKPQKLLL